MMGDALFAKREIDHRNVGLVATQRIPSGAVVFTEAPFVPSYVEIMMTFWARECPTGDHALDSECRAIKDEIAAASARKDVGSGAGGGEQQPHPVQVARLMDRLSEIFIIETFRGLTTRKQELWMSLHDQHQGQVPTDRASPVGIVGHTDERGRSWCGRIGVANRLSDDGRCFEVEVKGGEGGDAETLLVPRDCLKTPAGILRSNSFEDGGLFEVRCRLNHSCSPNTLALPLCEADIIPGLVAKDEQEIAIVAVRDIREGEELTNSYYNFSPGESTAARRKILMDKYGFHCQCQLCCDGEALPAPELVVGSPSPPSGAPEGIPTANSPVPREGRSLGSNDRPSWRQKELEDVRQK
jgi:hypothetical protein